MIDVDDKVARRKFIERFQRKRLTLRKSFFDFILMVSIENFVVGKAGKLMIMIQKSVADGNHDGSKLHIGIEVFEDLIKAFDLPWVIGEYIIAIAIFLIFLKRLTKQLDRAAGVNDRLPSSLRKG